jgi:putative SOS response-associated peptidase YedK
MHGRAAINDEIILNTSIMCGRYRLSRRKQLIEEYFDTAAWKDDWSPRYNIAPTQPVPVIRQHPSNPLERFR